MPMTGVRKVLHRTAIPLRSIAAGELQRDIALIGRAEV